MEKNFLLDTARDGPKQITSCNLMTRHVVALTILFMLSFNLLSYGAVIFLIIFATNLFSAMIIVYFELEG